MIYSVYLLLLAIATRGVSTSTGVLCGFALMFVIGVVYLFLNKRLEEKENLFLYYFSLKIFVLFAIFVIAFVYHNPTIINLIVTGLGFSCLVQPAYESLYGNEPNLEDKSLQDCVLSLLGSSLVVTGYIVFLVLFIALT